VAEARQAVALYPSDPWALALLGQCLQRQRASDPVGARRALERAWTLDQTNGYFVGLLLDVLRAQGDTAAARNVLEWSWWRGAPVERWLPDGPSMTEEARGTESTAKPVPGTAPAAETPRGGGVPGSFLAGRQPIPA